MTDPTNDIDALLRHLNGQWIVGTDKEIDEMYNGFASALTALVAERNALREQLRLANIDQFNTEAEANDRDRELRERNETMTKWMDQVTAMLCHSMTHSHDAKQELAARCDNAIAAMRKGDTNG